ncbi:hypothetical protein SH449x_002395 [Pirellulaceae bacterium SH449]
MQVRENTAERGIPPTSGLTILAEWQGAVEGLTEKKVGLTGCLVAWMAPNVEWGTECAECDWHKAGKLGGLVGL